MSTLRIARGRRWAAAFAVVTMSMGAFVMLAAGTGNAAPKWSVSILNNAVAGGTVTIDGVADSPAGEKSGNYLIVEWGDGASTQLPNFMGHGPWTWGPLEHALAPGAYTVVATLYHASVNGNDKSQATDSVAVVVPPIEEPPAEEPPAEEPPAEEPPAEEPPAEEPPAEEPPAEEPPAEEPPAEEPPAEEPPAEEPPAEEPPAEEPPAEEPPAEEPPAGDGDPIDSGTIDDGLNDDDVVGGEQLEDTSGSEVLGGRRIVLAQLARTGSDVMPIARAGLILLGAGLVTLVGSAIPWARATAKS